MRYIVTNADGHIDLNRDIWRDRVAAKRRNRAPKPIAMSGKATKFSHLDET